MAGGNRCPIRQRSRRNRLSGSFSPVGAFWSGSARVGPMLTMAIGRRRWCARSTIRYALYVWREEPSTSKASHASTCAFTRSTTARGTFPPINTMSVMSTPRSAGFLVPVKGMPCGSPSTDSGRAGRSRVDGSSVQRGQEGISKVASAPGTSTTSPSGRISPRLRVASFAPALRVEDQLGFRARRTR